MAATLGRADAYPLESYKRGTRVWLRDSETVWIRAELLEDLTFSTRVIRLRREEDDELIEEALKPDTLPFLANPEILIGKDDLTSLSYLHEPAVLHNLRYRFEKREQIYTYCGIVLVAINPYADCSQIYGDDVISIYGNAGNQGRSDLDPHIFAISAEAYYDMREYDKNQSIIVSGESGAGKTVSAKFVMKYLANVASSKKSRKSDGSPGIESRVLASNPIMESIGNAKTIRNDNSSRFGKFIQINFAEDFTIGGAEMKTYLLEKSRVVFQSKNERNYHVFYQMCAASSHERLSALKLDSSDDYFYTSQGEDPFIPDVDDAADFRALVAAFDMLKIDPARQSEIFKIFAGVLMLGNISFDPGNGDTSAVSGSCANTVAKICGSDVFNVDAMALQTWLTAREIRAGGEVVRKFLNTADAAANRDALAKMIYACMFNWIVDKVNENLDQHTVKPSKRGHHAAKFIGVLDIYGFETFEVNSFEQFCINYANEKLQQQFNQHVFKLEQLEYEKEEISWVRIDFYDNQPCIDLIEARPGIIDYLDEQCKMARGSDDGWLALMTNCQKLKKAPHLQMPKFKDSSFVIKHFAADVSYRIDGFLEKNKDTVNEQLLGVFAKTKFSFLKEVLRETLASSSTGAKRKKTVACQFRDSLSELITVLSSTRPHYVRCIKPNDDKERFYFEPKRAIQQLRACGVLETVRISAAGYPSRWAYDEFGRRYRVLYPEGKALWKHKPKDFAKLACEKWLECEMFALGKTKMFFRVGQVARLEKFRQDVLSASAVKIQTIWRGFVARRRYLHLMSSIRTIQATGRAFLAYRRLKYLQMHRATIAIQSCWRGFVERQRFLRLRQAIVAIQAAFRAREVRRRVLKIRYEKSAVTIQRYFRGYLVRREKIKRIRKIILAQCCVRRFLAKKQLKRLKAERTTVIYWKNEHQGLEKKIFELQGKLDAIAFERNQLAERCSTFDTLKAEVARLMLEREELLQIKEAKIELDGVLTELEAKCVAQASNISALDETVANLSRSNEQLNNELSQIRANQLRELEELRSKHSQLEESSKQLDNQLLSERDKVKRMTAENTEMRQQLAANAEMMVNEFSRGSEFRASMRSTSSDGQSTTDGAEAILVIKQQDCISELRRRLEQQLREKEHLRNEFSSCQYESSARRVSSLGVHDSLRYQDLEMELARMKKDLAQFCHDRGSKDGVEDYITSMMDACENHRHENVELRALLSTVFERKTAEHSPRPDGEDSCYYSTTNSDDGNSSLPNDLLDEQLERERLIRSYVRENQVLIRQVASRDKTINDLEEQVRQLKTINSEAGGDVSPTMSTTAIQSKVFCENMLLQQKLNNQADELSELRAQLRGYAGIPDSQAASTTSDLGSDTAGDADVPRLTALHADKNSHNGVLNVFNVPEFARVLIYELKPRLAKQLTPGLPAYLMLAGIRYYDREKDDTAITGLFCAVQSILKDIASSSNDADILCLWLVNSWKLFNLMRQYSGEENPEWSEKNTEKQNAHKVANFNLEPLRNQLKMRIEVFYQSFMKKTVEPLLSPKIVPGVLLHDSSQLLGSGGAPAHSGLTRQPSKDIAAKTLDDLIELLNMVYNRLRANGADHVLMGQVFWQITQWICAQALNNLMFRRDLCKFEKAIQIKHNVSEIQSWLYQKGLGEIRPVLEPLVQACHLLQSRKDDNNLDTLCGEMTSALNPRQVVSILQHYTPSDGFEEDAIDKEFLIKVQMKLNERAEKNGTRDIADDKEKLIIPGTFLVTFNTEPFVYSDYALEQLTLPTCLHLNSVARFA